jgi:isopentenyl diphosphate isomerase/L-lactate dehydrogenase-like FMN-dependent dehydrogenase
MTNQPTFDAYNIEDLRELAKRRLPKGLFEFVDRGTEDETALRRNRTALTNIKLRPRVLVDVAQRKQNISLFGHPQTMPIAIAPTGSAGLMWHNGEIALARAASKAGIPCTIATGAMTAIEKIAAQAPGTRLWFQLYMWPDRNLSYRLVERAKAAGYEGLVVTVDSPVPPSREYNLHNGFTIPFSFNRRNVSDVLMHPRWLLHVLGRYLVTTGMPRYENYPSEVKNRITALPMGRSMMLNDSLTWQDLRELRRMWPHKLMAKGIIDPADAVRAVECGVDGVIISNHGGRVVDSTLAPIEALPAVVAAVGSRTTVIVDSGFRRGTDVVKALALGADLVLIGRATLYGTAVGGEAGATRALSLLREEINRTMALIGCRSIAELSPEHVILPDASAAAA